MISVWRVGQTLQWGGKAGEHDGSLEDLASKDNSLTLIKYKTDMGTIVAQHAALHTTNVTQGSATHSVFLLWWMSSLQYKISSSEIQKPESRNH